MLELLTVLKDIFHFLISSIHNRFQIKLAIAYSSKNNTTVINYHFKTCLTYYNSFKNLKNSNSILTYSPIEIILDRLKMKSAEKYTL